jgi:sialate O-acetylesterase
VKAQNKFAAEQKNAAIAVTADVGNFSDIHPNNKEIVGRRLAVHALKNDYGFDIPETDSPVFKKVEFDGAKAKVYFDNAKSFYIYADNRSVEPAFELAEKDGAWMKAKVLNVKENGVIKGDYIELTCDKLKNPVKVRYMIKAYTMGTVYNEASLPLGPFESESK